MKLLKSVQELFLRVVGQIEGSPTPLARYAQLFLAILSVRLALEFFSSHRLYSLADIIHIGLWFAFIALAFLLQLHWFSREDIRKVVRLVVVGFTIALTAPILDLLISGGQGAKMNYLSINNWNDVLFAYVTVGGTSLTRGATLGIRIEIVLLVLASFNYVFLKTRSWPRAIVSSIVIYTVLFLSGTVPKLLGLTVETLHLQYAPGDASTILLLLCLDLLLLAVVLLRLAPRTARTAFRHANWALVSLCTVLFATGAGLAIRAYPDNWTFDPTTLFHFPLLAGLVLCFAALTGLLDMDLHGISANSAAKRNVLLAFMILVGYAISERFVFLVAVVWGLLFLLEEAPLMLRKMPLLRQLLGAMILLATLLAGFVAFGGPMLGLPGDWLLTVLLACFVGGLYRDLAGRGDDLLPWYSHWSASARGLFGRLAAVFVLAGVSLAALILLEPGWVQAAVALSLPSVAMVWTAPQRVKLATWLLLLPAIVFLIEVWIS